MDINLDGQIVVLDEAHNIEDCARESASYTVNYNSLLASRDDLESLVKNDIRRAKHEPLQSFCYSLIKLVKWRHWPTSCLLFIIFWNDCFFYLNLNWTFWYSWIQESQDLMCERGYESASKVWNGKEVIGIFHNLGITPATFNILKVHLMSRSSHKLRGRGCDWWKVN